MTSELRTSKPTRVELRSRRELQLMRRAGLLVWTAHQTVRPMLRPGVTTTEIDAVIADVFRGQQATPLFLGYPAHKKGIKPFPGVACISVNEQVVHGIPAAQRLKVGDILSIDTGCRLAGWCGDAAVTHAIGGIDDRAKTLLATTQLALHTAIELMHPGVMWSEIAKRMQSIVSDKGFSMVRSMVGHGIGREMHEPPQVPHYFGEWVQKEDFELRAGLVLAIEPMVTAGTHKLKTLKDGWTIVTADGKLSAHFEHTVAVTETGAWPLTGPPQEHECELVPERLRNPEAWLRW